MAKTGKKWREIAQAEERESGVQETLLFTFHEHRGYRYMYVYSNMTSDTEFYKLYHNVPSALLCAKNHLLKNDRVPVRIEDVDTKKVVLTADQIFDQVYDEWHE